MVSVRRVPAVSTELIGSGIMEWSRERDRYLNVSEGAALWPIAVQMLMEGSRAL